MVYAYSTLLVLLWHHDSVSASYREAELYDEVDV